MLAKNLRIGVIAASLPVLGVILCNWVTVNVEDDPIMRQRIQSAQRQPSNASQKEEVTKMLNGLSEKTAKEKLQSAYDAALCTHEIGFPTKK
mmetsp:Transcript_5627/g.6981  ORF Transcript_5627/g.6981 Transcript_5627/m.6981 type:complete len:92 (+) Transcript_5627:119-394(+)